MKCFDRSCVSDFQIPGHFLPCNNASHPTAVLPDHHVYLANSHVCIYPLGNSFQWEDRADNGRTHPRGLCIYNLHGGLILYEHTKGLFSGCGVSYMLCYTVVFYRGILFDDWNQSMETMCGGHTRQTGRTKYPSFKDQDSENAADGVRHFGLSWLPLYSLHLRWLFGPMPGSTEKIILRRYITPLVQWQGAANSCVNPFIYCYFSLHFRRSIIAVVQSRSCATPITEAWQKGAATGCRESIRMAQLWQKSPPAEGREQGRLTVYGQQEQDEYMETMFNMIVK